jgi:hypothetical protein
MTARHENPGGRPFRSYALATIKVISVVVVLAVLTHLSWNLFAPDLFGLPEVRMKQALGLCIFGGILTFMLRHGVKGGRLG